MPEAGRRGQHPEKPWEEAGNLDEARPALRDSRRVPTAARVGAAPELTALARPAARAGPSASVAPPPPPPGGGGTARAPN